MPNRAGICPASFLRFFSVSRLPKRDGSFAALSLGDMPTFYLFKYTDPKFIVQTGICISVDHR